MRRDYNTVEQLWYKCHKFQLFRYRFESTARENEHIKWLIAHTVRAGLIAQMRIILCLVTLTVA